MGSPIVPYTLDEYFQSTPLGSINRAIGNNLYGVNHCQIPNMVPSSRDTFGLTFFVRPQLNLQSDNIRNFRRFYPLLNKEANSVQRFVRCALDPRLMYSYSLGSSEAVAAIGCPLLDPQQAFLPVLTNNLLTISGWPDITIPTFTSKEGLYKEAYSQVDGVIPEYEAFSLDATFRNTRGDVILYLFYIWAYYMTKVFEGVLMPYPDFISDNRIDYNTRVYRLALDPTRRYITKIAACGVAFPLTDPVGRFFDFNTEQPYNDQSKEITIRFQCLGAQYLDDILIEEFNQTVQIFHPGMRDANRENTLYRVDPSLLIYFNNRGYPRIDPTTYALEWWVDAAVFDARTRLLSSMNVLNQKQKTQLEALASSGD